MKFLILIVAAFQIRRIVCHENEEMFMCRKVGQESDSQHTGKTTQINMGKPSHEANKESSKDQIIDILEERLRVLEMRVMLLESQKNSQVSPRSDQEIRNLLKNEDMSTPPMEAPPPTPTHEPHELCDIFHRDRCFTFVKSDQGTIGLKAAQKKCKEVNGDLANIYDEHHFAKIEGYLQQHTINGNRQEYFIVGMTYNVKKNVVTLRGGERASFVNWYSEDYPNRRSRTNTRIHVQINPQSMNIRSGMYNVSPNSRARSALCEIHPRNL